MKKLLLIVILFAGVLNLQGGDVKGCEYFVNSLLKNIESARDATFFVEPGRLEALKDFIKAVNVQIRKAFAKLSGSETQSELNDFFDKFVVFKYSGTNEPKIISFDEFIKFTDIGLFPTIENFTSDPQIREILDNLGEYLKINILQLKGSGYELGDSLIKVNSLLNDLIDILNGKSASGAINKYCNVAASNVIDCKELDSQITSLERLWDQITKKFKSIEVQDNINVAESALVNAVSPLVVQLTLLAKSGIKITSSEFEKRKEQLKDKLADKGLPSEFNEIYSDVTDYIMRTWYLTFYTITGEPKVVMPDKARTFLNKTTTLLNFLKSLEQTEAYEKFKKGINQLPKLISIDEISQLGLVCKL